MESWFAKMRGFWNDRLDTLERALSKGEEE